MSLPWPTRLDRWRVEIEAAAEDTELAPELIAAIIDRESGGGIYLSPRGPAGTGDHGFGHGLMQIDSRSHQEWLQLGTWMNAADNIMFGSRLLKAYVEDVGSIPGGIAAYNAGPTRAKRIVATFGPDVNQLDSITTNHNYVSDVLARSEKLQSLELEG